MPEVKVKLLLPFLFVIIFCTSCVAPRMVRPLEDEQNAFRVDLGYVLEDSITKSENQKFTASITYARGLSDNTTGYFTLRGNYFRLPILEAGILHSFKNSEGIIPGFSSSFTVSGVVLDETPDFILLLQAAPNLYWEFTEKKHFIYVGSSLWIWPNDKYLIRFAPHIGSALVFNKYELNLEFKYTPKDSELFDPLLLNQSYGMYIGVTRKF
jgi:hypothetical protein